MKKKIFFRFSAVSFTAVLLMFVFGIIAVNITTKNVINERLKEETELTASLLKEGEDFGVFDKYANDPDLRITVFDHGGNVLYESDTQSELDNHKDREEIKNALSGTPEAVERYSETFRCDMTYYATNTVMANGDAIILRLAVRSSEVTPYITAILPLLLVILAFVLILSFVLSSILSKSVSAKITEIGDSLKSLNDGDYVPIKTDRSEPELLGVLNQINELNSNIHDQIRITEDEKKKLNAVVDNVSQSIIALDDSSDIVFANKRTYEMFGLSQGISSIKLGDIPIADEIMKELPNGGTITCKYKDSYLSVVICKVKSGGISNIVILTDITKEKLIEKQKSDFFANASHELKTPVTVLRGFSEVLLNKDGIDDVSKKQLSRIHKESIRLGSLISDMLMLSSIENGNATQTAPSTVYLDEVTYEIIAGLSEEIKKKDLTVNVTGRAGVISDRNMIFELVENLISNAVKYNKDGGSLTVNITDGEIVRLEVKDTGIGIEKEHLPRLCERFYRVDKSHSKRIGGTGLGLAIVKHVCAVTNAELAIDSEYGKGSVFSVTFKK